MFVLDASNIKKARITIFLITFNTLLYLFFSFGNLEDLFYLLVQINSKVVYDLELWRLITSMFLHGDALHLFSNMVSLLIFGSYIELSFSKFKFVLIYFVSGFLGSLFTVFLLPLNTISLGASGAVFGLIGAALSILIVERNNPLIILGLIYVFYFVFSSFSPGINYFAHIFGLLGGFVTGFILRRNKSNEQLY
ncbi:MAG: rhomboid family intramembrane serine protease [Candidatus Lokiarchaeota archaeon]|nr:rhomboid family intramembrane serine protease [Candidatus Lokiarchaeota archaeon]